MNFTSGPTRNLAVLKPYQLPLHFLVFLTHQWKSFESIEIMIFRIDFVFARFFKNRVPLEGWPKNPNKWWKSKHVWVYRLHKVFNHRLPRLAVYSWLLCQWKTMSSTIWKYSIDAKTVPDAFEEVPDLSWRVYPVIKTEGIRQRWESFKFLFNIVAWSAVYIRFCLGPMLTRYEKVFDHKSLGRHGSNRSAPPTWKFCNFNI